MLTVTLAKTKMKVERDRKTQTYEDIIDARLDLSPFKKKSSIGV